MKKQGKIQLLDIVPIFILAGIFIIFTVASNGATLSSYNLKLLCTNVVPVIIGSLGCIFVIALGGTDISIGASAALCSSIAAVISAQTAGWVAIPVTIILSTALGALIGFISVLTMLCPRRHCLCRCSCAVFCGGSGFRYEFAGFACFR